MRVDEIGKAIDSMGIFTGGPTELFESAGRLQFYSLIREGLCPYSKLLDIGCGCLRGGYWLIRFLDPGCYFGIEPNSKMLQAGIETCVTPAIVAAKQPRFDNNDHFDFSVFGTNFDVFLARSIWSHASKQQIQIMLDGFARFSNPGGFLLTSYLPVNFLQPAYEGVAWVGRSHQGDKAGMVRHSRRWLEGECIRRGLALQQLREKPFAGQYWVKITKG